jgi:hypothetical protein
MLSGPKGNSQGIEENKGLHQILDKTGKYKFVGEQPFEVTNWDPALTQKVLSAAIAKNPKIDVIVSDFGPSLVGALPRVHQELVEPFRRLQPSDGNVLGCFWKKQHAKNPTFKLMTVLDSERPLRVSQSSGRLRWPAAARSRHQRTSRRCCSKTRDWEAQHGAVSRQPAGRYLSLGAVAGSKAGKAR